MHDHDVARWTADRKADIAEFIQELIRGGAPEQEGSDAPGVERAVETTVATARALGFEAEVRTVDKAAFADHPAFVGSPDGTATYVVARRRGGGGGRSLVLNGHIDVVASGDPAAWTHPPYAGVLDEYGNIHGRGASDAKGPFVAVLYGSACAADLGALQGDLTVVAATDEEVGGMSSLASLIDGITGDAVLVGEPTELDLAPAGRGIMGFQLRVAGKQAHPGAGFEGVNAIVKMAPYVLALDALQAELDERFPNELYRAVPVGHCLNIGRIDNGTATRVVPGECTIDGVAPTIGRDDPNEIRAAVVETVDRVTQADEWLREHPPTLTWGGMTLGAAFTEPDHPFVAGAAAAVARVRGSEPAVLPLLGASDLRFYSGSFDIPGTHLGPGAMSRGHGANEFVELDSLLTGVRSVAAIALDWAGCACPACGGAGA